MEWQLIETCPDTGFFLVHEDGAIRTMARFDGKWELPDIPIMINEYGDHLVSRDVERVYGMKLGISAMIHDPTHWMPLPKAPNDGPQADKP